MTGTEWRYLQKIALDHPYYDTHKLPLTEAEARAIAKQNNTLTGEQFVDSVYAKLGMTRPAKEKKRFAWLRGVGALFAVPPIRRIAIAVLAVLLLTVFFAATPAGRAIAESVIEYVVRLFDNNLEISQGDSKGEITVIDNFRFSGNEKGDGSDGQFVESLDDFTRATGKTPFVLPFKCVEIILLEDPLCLSSVYETPSGKVTAIQIWEAKDYFFTDVNSFTSYGENVYYSVDNLTDTISCVKVLEDSVVCLSAKGIDSIDSILNLLTNE